MPVSLSVKLERQVLEETWRLGEVSVRDVHRAFDERIAYTTLMTTLDRLFKKKLLERRKDGRAFLYAALVSRDDLDQGIKEDVVDGLARTGCRWCGASAGLHRRYDQRTRSRVTRRTRSSGPGEETRVATKDLDINVRVSRHHLSPALCY